MRVGHKIWRVTPQGVAVPTDILTGSQWTLGQTKGAQQVAPDAPCKAWLRIILIENGSAAPSGRIRFDDTDRGHFYNTGTVSPMAPLYLSPPQLPPLDLTDLRERPRLESTYLPAATTFTIEAFYLLED